MKNKFQHIKAPSTDYSVNELQGTIFLAGAIDMGNAVNWQQELADALSIYPELVLFDPRRDDWNSSWKQEKNDPQFSEQVNWELEHITGADLVIFVFPKESKAPVSFLELGLCLGLGLDMFVYVHPEFYRKGNIDITAERFGAPVVNSMDELVVSIKERFGL